jgi:hypothetical protein
VLGFPGRRSGETRSALWFPLLVSVVLLAVVVAVHWSVWDAFGAELRKNAPVAIPLVAVLAVTVLVPPLAWVVSTFV